MAGRDDPFSKRHHFQKISTDADQTEFLAVRRGEAMVEAGVIDDRIAGAMDDFTVDGVMPDWQSTDLQNDNAASALMQEIARRSETLGAEYPFELKGARLRHVKSKTNVYEFCLAVGQTPSLTEGDFKSLPRLFERVSARVLADYVGPPCDFLHTGAPRDGTPSQTFKNAIETLHGKSGEWRWDPETDLPPDGPATGDEGADFFVWKLAPDGRSVGQIFLIGQCACGGDWRGKWTDLDVSRLSKWARNPTLLPPIRAFATPFVISDGLLKEASRQAGLVFDRLRLSKVAATQRVHLTDAPWVAEMQSAIKLVADAL